jgi:hypothetical protein
VKGLPYPTDSFADDGSGRSVDFNDAAAGGTTLKSAPKRMKTDSVSANDVETAKAKKRAAKVGEKRRMCISLYVLWP